jgi:hypothetical protein
MCNDVSNSDKFRRDTQSHGVCVSGAKVSTWSYQQVWTGFLQLRSRHFPQRRGFWRYYIIIVYGSQIFLPEKCCALSD